MKKVVGLLLAGVLCAGTAMTAFAADSVDATSGCQYNLSLWSSTSPTVLSQYYDTDEELEAAQDVKSDPTSALAEVGLDEDAYELIGLFDISDETYSSGEYTCTLTYAGDLDADDDVVVLHYTDGAWTEETSEPGDGELTITASSLSPFAIYVASTDDDSTTTSDDTDDESPTTGETSAVPYAVLIAIIAAAGVAVSSRKRRA